MNNGFALYGATTALASSINKQLTSETPFVHQYSSPAVAQSQHQYNPLNVYSAQTDYPNGTSFASSLAGSNYGDSQAKEEKSKSNHYPVIHTSNSVNSNVVNNLSGATLYPTNPNLSCLSSSNCSNFSTSSSSSSLENSTLHPSLHSSNYYYSRQQHYQRSSSAFTASSSPRSLISNSYTSKLNQNQPIHTSASSYYHFHQQLSAQSESSSLSSSSSIDYSNPSQAANQAQAEEDYSVAFYKQHLLMNDAKNSSDYINSSDHHPQMAYNDYQLSNSKDNFSLNVSNWFINCIIISFF